MLLNRTETQTCHSWVETQAEEVVMVCALHVECEFTEASFSPLSLTLGSGPSQIPFPPLFHLFLQPHFILNPVPLPLTLFPLQPQCSSQPTSLPSLKSPLSSTSLPPSVQPRPPLQVSNSTSVTFEGLLCTMHSAMCFIHLK